MTGPGDRPGGELRIRGRRGAFVVTLAVGLAGLALAAAFEPFRKPYAIALFGVAAVIGVVGFLDRRVKLVVSQAGIRYARWGPAVIPWAMFSGYRTVRWRGSPYLQLGVSRPPQVLERFSTLGRLNHLCARLIGMPVFGIAITPLSVSERQLESHVSRYLQKSNDR